VEARVSDDCTRLAARGVERVRRERGDVEGRPSAARRDYELAPDESVSSLQNDSPFARRRILHDVTHSGNRLRRNGLRKNHVVNHAP
jgi:hypothetical protein